MPILTLLVILAVSFVVYESGLLAYFWKKDGGID